MNTSQIERIEPPLGKGEVVSSILTGSTTKTATVSAMAYFAAVAAFSINVATSGACARKTAWLLGSSMTCDWARFAMNRSRSGLIIRSCVATTA